jgi:hypothetical protein
VFSFCFRETVDSFEKPVHVPAVIISINSLSGVAETMYSGILAGMIREIHGPRGQTGMDDTIEHKFCEPVRQQPELFVTEWLFQNIPVNIPELVEPGHAAVIDMEPGNLIDMIRGKGKELPECLRLDRNRFEKDAVTVKDNYQHAFFP